MAEGRMIKKRISKSKKIAALKIDSAGLLYFMILPHLDIKGRYEADPTIIKGQIVPYLKAFTLRKIQIYLEELNRVGLIILYQADSEQFLQYTRFEDFQRLDPKKEAKSEIPPPTPEQLQSKSRETPAEVKVKLSISKEKYGDFVLLTLGEYEKLIAEYGKGIIKTYMDRLNNYIGSKGRKYKSHYHTLLVWLNKDNIKKLPKTPAPKEEVNPKERKKVAALVHKTTKDMGKK